MIAVRTEKNNLKDLDRRVSYNGTEKKTGGGLALSITPEHLRKRIPTGLDPQNWSVYKLAFYREEPDYDAGPLDEKLSDEYQVVGYRFSCVTQAPGESLESIDLDVVGIVNDDFRGVRIAVSGYWGRKISTDDLGTITARFAHAYEKAFGGPKTGAQND